MNGQLDLDNISPPKLFIIASAVLGLLFALSSESSAGTLNHFLQWQIQTTGAVIVILGVHKVLQVVLGRIALNPWLTITIAGVLGALAFAPVALFSDVFLGKEILENSWGKELVSEAMAILPPMTIAWIAMNAPWLMGNNKPGQVENTEEKQQSDKNKQSAYQKSNPNFLSLTRLENSDSILYLKSELHYVNVVSMNDKQLILISLKEAISQLDAAGIDGAQCHRGYWVAQSAVEHFNRSGRQAEFKLKNGEKIPISRTNVKHCQAMAEHS